MDTSRLPYNDRPPTLMELTDELQTFVACVAGVMANGGEQAPAMLADATKEPGQSVMAARTRYALALNAYISGELEDLVRALTGAPDRSSSGE